MHIYANEAMDWLSEVVFCMMYDHHHPYIVQNVFFIAAVFSPPWYVNSPPVLMAENTISMHTFQRNYVCSVRTMRALRFCPRIFERPDDVHRNIRRSPPYSPSSLLPHPVERVRECQTNCFLLIVITTRVHFCLSFVLQIIA